MSESGDSRLSRDLLLRYQAGDLQAADEILDRYTQRLFALAGHRVGQRLRRRIDVDDVLQSAYASFFIAARQ